MASVDSAVEMNNPRMLKLLVGPPGLVSSKELHRALVKAVTLDHLECVRVLTDVSLDLDLQGQDGNSLLRNAVEKDRTDIVSLLVQSGCPVSAPDSSETTVLHLAARMGCSGSVAVLLAQTSVDKDACDSVGNTPLILAARCRHKAWDAMKLLIGAKCALNAQNDEQKTALHYLCQSAIGVDLMLQAGADPNIPDSDGNTPMMIAATEGFDNVICSLLRHGADPNLVNFSRKAPVHFLAMKNHWRAISAIATHGGNLDILDDAGKSPLWYAISRNRPLAVKSLLRANCRTDMIQSSTGNCEDLLELALSKDLYGVAKLLVLAGCGTRCLNRWLENEEERKQASRSPRHPSLFVHGEDEDSESEDEEKAEVTEFFKCWIHHPQTLRQLCRVMIRRLMGPRIHLDWESLPVPSAIQDFVTLKEVEDFNLDDALL